MGLARATSTRTNPSDLMAPGTSMDAVTLNVSDIDAMADFYHRAIALHVIGPGPVTATLRFDDPWKTRTAVSVAA